MEIVDLRSLIRSILSANYKSGNGFVMPECKLISLINHVSTIFDGEPALLELDGDYKIIGDIHGDIISLLRFFEECGYPSENNHFLFLGDYVDRGKHSIEVLELLFALKTLFPTSIYMLKGNHECSDVCSTYGFHSECLERSTEDVFGAFCTSFSKLPIAAVLRGRAFCVHGGISPLMKTKDDIANIKKCDIPELDSIVADMLWSDPSESVDMFGESSRTIGYKFGWEAAAKILDMLDVFTIIRAHEFVEYGYQEMFDVITVFSAIDYCGQGNDGAFLSIACDATLTQDIEFNVLRPLMKKRFVPSIPHFLDETMHESLSLDEITLSDLITSTVCN